MGEKCKQLQLCIYFPDEKETMLPNNAIDDIFDTRMEPSRILLEISRVFLKVEVVYLKRNLMVNRNIQSYFQSLNGT